MAKLSCLRDHALVAFLQVREYPVTPNHDGSFTVHMSQDDFYREEQEFQLNWRPILRRMATIKRSISRPNP